MITVETRLWKKRSLAVAIMTLLLLAVLVVPLLLTIGTIVAHVDLITSWAKSLADFKMPAAPESVSNLPIIGPQTAKAWKEIAAVGIEGIANRIAPYAAGTIKWFVGQVGNVGVLFVEFLLTVILAATIYANGEFAADRCLRFGFRLGGANGENSVRLAGQTVRGVALGVVVTALAQSVLGGIGLVIGGVPFAPVLTALMFVLCIAQIGPLLVLAPAVAWTYWSGSSGWGTFLLVWSAIVVSMDNFLRPALIRKGADLPLLLIFAGVIGGLLAFGLIGIFVGPVILAVSYTLFGAWVDEVPDIQSNNE
jgi:predicted PurR-regulated permease PerM